jgi:hypothetical protein
MIRCKFALAALTMLGLCVGLAISQDAQPKGKDKKGPATPTVDQLLEPDTYKDDLKTVREGGLKGEAADLLDYFRKRTLKQPDPKQVAALVKQLGDEEFTAREKAFVALLELEASALAGLKEGESDPSLEVRKRVADLKQRIDNKAEPTKQAAAARILAKLKPEGMTDTLLAFLPFSNDPMVVDEVCKALGAVAVVNGKADPQLVNALADPVAVKRGAAGEALIRGNVKDAIPSIKKLLSDKDVSVRLRISLAMLRLQDKDVVPVLIDLLGELSANQLWPVEEALLRLAGDKAPAVSLGTDEPSRKACRAAWAKWHAVALKDNTLDMARLSQENIYLGYTLIVQMNNRIGGPAGFRQGTGEVYELDKDKRVRWKIELTTQAVDAQMVGASRVLIAEYLGAKVTERDLKGDIKWEYPCGGNPIAVQRLANGNTFIAMQGRLVEVDRNKTEVWSYQRQQPDIVRAKKLPNGEVVFVHHNNFAGNNTSTCVRIDGKTKETIKSFNVQSIQMNWGSIDVLPNGNIIIPHYQTHQVREYDPNGGQVKTLTGLNWPNSVQRLPNGHTLVTSYSSRQIVEFDANGAQVSSHTVDGLIFNARRR